MLNVISLVEDIFRR